MMNKLYLGGKYAYAKILERFKPVWMVAPEYLQLDVNSGKCNNRCVYCNVNPDAAYRTKPQDMSMTVFNDALKATKSFRHILRGVACWMNGDPIIESRLDDMHDLVSEYGYYGIVDSNGTIPARVHALMHPAVRTIRISLSAHNRELYKTVHGTDNFNNVLYMLRYLKAFKKSYQRLFINHMICKQNIDYVNDFLKRFKGYSIQLFPLHSSPLQQNSVDNLVDVSKTIRVNPDSSQVDMHAEIRKKQPCQCWNLQGIGPNGEIMHCVDFPADYNYGTIYDHSLIDAWRKRNRIGVQHPLCQECSLLFPEWRDAKDLRKRWIELNKNT